MVRVVGDALDKLHTELFRSGTHEDGLDYGDAILGDLGVAILVLEGDVPPTRSKSQGGC